LEELTLEEREVYQRAQDQKSEQANSKQQEQERNVALKVNSGQNPNNSVAVISSTAGAEVPAEIKANPPGDAQTG
jgi:hypothetical protein